LGGKSATRRITKTKKETDKRKTKRKTQVRILPKYKKYYEKYKDDALFKEQIRDIVAELKAGMESKKYITVRAGIRAWLGKYEEFFKVFKDAAPETRERWKAEQAWLENLLKYPENERSLRKYLKAG
jgi:hypothetical protein